jgi:hypothetical protein
LRFSTHPSLTFLPRQYSNFLGVFQQTVKGQKTAAKPVKQARRKMSAASRAKIAAAAKARWKKAKAQGKNSL